MTIPLSRSATFTLDLAQQPDGYLVFENDVIDELRNAGLVTTRSVGGGFVIARAVRRAKRHDHAMNWRWYRARRASEQGITP